MSAYISECLHLVENLKTYNKSSNIHNMVSASVADM